MGRGGLDADWRPTVEPWWLFGRDSEEGVELSEQVSPASLVGEAGRDGCPSEVGDHVTAPPKGGGASLVLAGEVDAEEHRIISVDRDRDPGSA